MTVSPLSQWPLLPFVALLLFCGVIGKSAQLPLHVWLPDAMEGPTPVSALIHAATMVAAGVYMLCRIFFLLVLAPEALTVIAWIGGLTALFAALWAVTQDDIKRILAYSTMSQLGLMVMSVGLAGPGPAMFHLTTHAFFKALLFLGAGSVLVAVHHEQNIWKMGGLRSRMPVTFLTFLVGTLALCGVPGLSGFFSKDEILMAAYGRNLPLFYIGTVASFLTAFYMGRLLFVVFLGKPRTPVVEHARENGLVILAPLCILAVLAFAGGWSAAGIGHYLDGYQGFAGHLEPVSCASAQALLFVLPFIGLGLAWAFYREAAQVDTLEIMTPQIYRFLLSRFGFDEIYDGLVRNVQGFVTLWSDRFDRWVVDGLGVKGLSLSVLCFGNFLRCFQTGSLQTYLVFFGLGVSVLIYWMVVR